MNLSPVELAARNNAIWCDTICRAHGAPGEFFPTVWLNRGSPLPFHSNLVVLSGTTTTAQRTAVKHIRALMLLPLPARWSVKDSYANLDLAQLGFNILFQASWVWREPAPSQQGRLPTELHWSRLASPTELARWEAAWSGNSRNEANLQGQGQFPASLLADPEIAVFSGIRDREIVAGGIANRSGNVIGLTNVFVNAADSPRLRTGLIDSVQEVFPGLPLVGYERGRDLKIAQACGFNTIGPLRVWIRIN